jgi:maleylpyruvate isomerase
MKLFGFWRSTATWRVRIGLAWKGLAYDYQPVHLFRDGGDQNRDDYARVNPMRQVPVLELDDGTRLTQSMAILDFLEATHPAPPLFPATPLLRARARELAEIVVSGIQPLQNTSVQRMLKVDLRVDEKAWTRHWVEKGLAALETRLAETAGRFSVGDQVSIADLCLVPEMYFARRFAIDLARYPIALRIESACAALDAFARAHADAQPDAEPPR